MNKKQVLEICSNAKSDILLRMYIDLANDLKVINTEKERLKEKSEFEHHQYLHLGGMINAYMIVLSKIEKELNQQ